MANSVIHLNLPSFQATVMTLKDTTLRGWPYVIAHTSAARPIVIASSEKAYQEGVRVGMSLAQASSSVPKLKILPPDPLFASQVERSLLQIASRYTPVIQHAAQGEFFLDVKGTQRLFGPPIDCSVRLKNAILKELSLEVAVAAATNKLVAKIATRTIRPRGVIEVREGEESPFLAVQESCLLPGVGTKIGALFKATDLNTIGQVATLTDSEVTALLGKKGLILRQRAQGIDPSCVDPRALSERTICGKASFGQSAFTLDEIRAGVLRAVEEAGLALRSEDLACYRLELALYYSDGKHYSAGNTLKYPLQGEAELFRHALLGCQRLLVRKGRINSVQVQLSHLEPAGGQDLFVPEALEKVVDATRVRYGEAGLRRASSLFYV